MAIRFLILAASVLLANVECHYPKPAVVSPVVVSSAVAAPCIPPGTHVVTPTVLEPCPADYHMPITVDNESIRSKMDEVIVKGTAVAKVLTAKLSAPVVSTAAAINAYAGALPAILAAKSAYIGKLIAMPITIGATATAGVASGVTGFLVGVPVGIGTGVAAGVTGVKEALKNPQLKEELKQKASEAGNVLLKPVFLITGAKSWLDGKALDYAGKGVHAYGSLHQTIGDKVGQFGSKLQGWGKGLLNKGLTKPRLNYLPPCSQPCLPPCPVTTTPRPVQPCQEVVQVPIKNYGKDLLAKVNSAKDSLKSKFDKYSKDTSAYLTSKSKSTPIIVVDDCPENVAFGDLIKRVPQQVLDAALGFKASLQELSQTGAETAEGHGVVAIAEGGVLPANVTIPPTTPLPNTTVPPTTTPLP